MANANKRKGDAFELSVQRYLSERLDCERIPAGATVDRGDLWTRTCLVQCKNQKSIRLGEWLRETIQQQQDARKELHALVIKRYRSTDPADQYVVMTLAQLREMLATVNNCNNPSVTDA
jgi:hypothetical protein